MDSNRRAKICFLLALLFVIGFFIKVALDYRAYTSMLTAVPFYLRVVLDAVFILLPAFILTIIGIALKKKARNDHC